MASESCKHASPEGVVQAFAQLNLIGKSPLFVAALRRIERMASADATVLIQGETGTGKELAARAIHYLSARRDGPFIPINCGAIPDSLLENELFGHAKGAFTDARDGVSGIVAEAEGGNLFLDEVEALSPRGQVILLRFLQDYRYRPLGGRRLVEANVRIIAASNADLEQMVQRRDFRADLMYRLAIMPVSLPPLRARRGDVALLSRHFVRRFNERYRTDATLSDASVDVLDGYDWPGNVRELENLLHREVLLCEGGDIEVAARMPPLPSQAPGEGARADRAIFERGFSAAKASMIDEFEREFVQWALARSGGNVSAAARRAGKERRSFGRLIKKHRIDRTSHTV